MSGLLKGIRATSVAVGAFVLSGTVIAQNDQSTMALPRIEHGQLISPVPTPVPTPTPSYPRIEEGRLQINKDVSVGGTILPPTVNVRVPMPEKKK